jgi:protein AroM
MLGLVTIGVSPREDIVSSMFGSHPPDALVQSGALDGKSDDEVCALAPRDGESMLVTRWTDGREVHLGEHRLLPHVQGAVEVAIGRGATVVCILCTGEFRTISSRVRLVTPDRLVASVVDALLPAGTLGILMPDAEQAPSVLAKWQSPGRQVVARSLSPFRHQDAVAAVASDLREAGAELVVLDCMAYTRELCTQVRAHLDVPVILSNALTGAILGELIS